MAPWSRGPGGAESIASSSRSWAKRSVCAEATARGAPATLPPTAAVVGTRGGKARMLLITTVRSSCQVLGQVLVPGPRARSSLQVLAPGPRTRSAACARSSSQDLARGVQAPPWWSSQEDLTGGPHQQSCVWAAEFVRALPTETGEFESRSLTQKQQKPSRARPRRAAQAARLRSAVQWSQHESLPRTSSCCALRCQA